MLAYIVAGLTVTLIGTAVARFWKRCFGNPDSAGLRPLSDRTSRVRPADARSSPDGPPDARSSSDGATHSAETPKASDGPPPADARSSPD